MDLDVASGAKGLRLGWDGTSDEFALHYFPYYLRSLVHEGPVPVRLPVRSIVDLSLFGRAGI